MDDRSLALVGLGNALKEAGYAFVTVSPETHRRVDTRAEGAAHAHARSLRDVFGWSRPFDAKTVPAQILELARAAGVITEEGDSGLLRARVRFSSLRGELFVHSAYPTVSADAVFFGPDTYRYCDLVAQHLEDAQSKRAKRVVDIGCGSGAGGIVAAARADTIVLADVNHEALRLAAVNATLAALERRVEIVESDVLGGVTGPVDLVIANPPYMLDGKGRTYRDGGGEIGEGLGVRIAREALARLEPGGSLVLYTGAAIVEGGDTFLTAVRSVCEEADAEWRYWELDPDVFGEEIEQNDAYAKVERIAAVALVATRR